MNNDSPLYWSFPAGTWFMTRVRISVFFPLIFVLLMFRFDDAKWGIITGLVLLAVTIVHEFGHVFAARLTGGAGDDILIWPLGGLAFVQTGYTLFSRIMTPLAGPLVHLVFCIVLSIPVYQAGELGHALNPAMLGQIDLSSPSFATTLCIVGFAVNYLLLIINLIPVYPLDGGQILQAILNNRMGKENSTAIYIRVGTIMGLLILLGGVLIDHTGVTCFGAFILILNMQETMRIRSGESYEENFMGYDFSQGYTSLERSAEGDKERPPRKGMIQRWRERRAAEKAERERAVEAEEKRQMDAILDKLHSQGQDALSDSERALLKRASARLRNRDRE